MARVAGWNNGDKSVHLITALKGTARAFCRSCSAAQRADYMQVVSAMKRFTLMKLTVLQTQMFHSRRQGPDESVDDFAHRLHTKAYLTATSACAEVHIVGHMVLVNQIVSGLHSELQAKVVCVEGTMDEMVTKADFEETKQKELASKTSLPFQKKPAPYKGPSVSSLNKQQPQTLTPATTPSVSE